MERETSLLLDVTVALALALAGGWIATRLRLPALLGYIAAGIVISPFTPGFVGDVDRLRLIADIGIVLLLFATGVQFSLSDLLRVGPGVIVAALVQALVVMGCIVAVAIALDWSRDAALYAGAGIAMSSSVVLVKLLDSRGETGSLHGRVAVTASLAQDLLAVVLIVVLATVTEESNSGGAVVRESAFAGLKAAVFVSAVVIIGLRVIPPVLNQVAEERSRELFFVAIATMVIGTALASEWAGLSLALGAFLAGIVVSESDLSHRVLGELLPTRDVFAVLFFVSAGMLADPAVVRDEWPAVLAFTALLFALKPIVFTLAGGRFVQTASTALLASVLLVPAGEFTFLLAADGLDNDALSDKQFSVVLTSAVLSIAGTPIALNAADRWVRRRGTDSQPAAAAGPPSRLGRRAVIAGYDRTGQTVARLLYPRFDALVVESAPRLARLAREHGLPVLEGNPASPAVVARMELGDARVLIITTQDPFAARALTEQARAANPHLEIVAHAVISEESEKLLRSGADDAVTGEDEVALELARHGLRRFGVSSAEAMRIVQRQRAEARRAAGRA
ncbi:MAG TPA: cation:proton antiporter [Dehalococcoidia bacterium]